MKIAIIGVGGVGGYFGGMLARAGADITFVARGEHYQALATEGLLLRSVDGEFRVKPLSVVDSIAKLPSVDVVLLTTKTYDRDQAAKELSSVVTESTIVVPIQNGIDNDLCLKKILPKARVFAGLCYIISARIAPGVVQQTGGPRTIFFGDRSGQTIPELQELAEFMRAAGLNATASTDVEHDMWVKFIWLTAFAGMTSVCRSSIGPIVSSNDGFEMLVRCLDEAIAVARASGVRLSDSDREEMLKRSADYRQQSPAAKSSMLVDIENQRRTEIESLNGTIVRLAKEKGINVPTHELITLAVKAASDSYLSR